MLSPFIVKVSVLGYFPLYIFNNVAVFFDNFQILYYGPVVDFPFVLFNIINMDLGFLRMIQY